MVSDAPKPLPLQLTGRSGLAHPRKPRSPFPEINRNFIFVSPKKLSGNTELAEMGFKPCKTESEIVDMILL
jgi:hypothetical protein